MNPKPVINVHTHIFSAKDVPPFIARSFIPWPLYLLTYFPAVFKVFQFYNGLYQPIQSINNFRSRILGTLKSYKITHFLLNLVLYLLLANSVYFIAGWCGILPESGKIYDIISWLENHWILYPGFATYAEAGTVVLAFLSTNLLRKTIWGFLTLVVKPLGYLPDVKTLEFIKRYLKIAKIANYKSQRTAFNKLYKMYPPGSKFVVLPMDMEYMNRTRPRSYLEQLDEIIDMKTSVNENYRNLIPFLFVDPRRIREQKNQRGKLFFEYELVGDNVHLKDCLVKDFLEKDDANPRTGHFRGIKIYPALGYHVFDEDLLPLWLYCVQKGIPITSHCIKGTIFYRRSMKNEWFRHPVFKDEKGESMAMYAKDNFELQKNFTHPLNYLVLLEPLFLADLVKNASDEIKKLFGYNPADHTLERNLSKLKINLAHYGGDDQWEKHLESDRLEEAQELVEMPETGIRMFSKQSDPSVIDKAKPANLWNKVDWYAIISSLMLQYENVYADISYILHTPEISELLNWTLKNPNLCKKVLFGTDYYVVRNHKSEKELYAEIFNDLEDLQLDMIAIENPNSFLKLNGETHNIL